MSTDQPHEFQQFEILEVEIQMRETYKGRAVKPECLQLNGQRFNVEVMWQQDQDEKYPGEWALQENTRSASIRESSLWTKAGIAWIASGDVKVIRQIDFMR